MQAVSYREAWSVWWRIGLMSFGGPAGQIALMHRIIVEEKKWLDEDRFLHALNYCMLLPGPEAQQLATYVGWLLHGVKGGVVAGLLFIVPGALAILAFSWAYVLLADLSLIEGLFFGLKAAVLAIVVQALMRIGRRTLTGRLKPGLAIMGFVALFAFNIPFPIVVLGAGIIGFLGAHWFQAQGQFPSEKSISSAITQRPYTLQMALSCLLLWGLIVGGLFALLGTSHVYTEIALFFSKMAVVTFGGAYAVLAYVAQQGVETYQWLQPGEMLDGLALAETTPGPLILVTQFVGFLAALRESGVEPALLGATLGALLTTAVTFLPCFLWIFLGAPYAEKLRGHQALSGALAAITAVVVGVIANLALWFALNALFAEQARYTGYGMDLLIPVVSSLNPVLLGISVIAFLLVFQFKRNLFTVLAVCSLLGVGWILFKTA